MRNIITGLLLLLMIGSSGCAVVKTDTQEQVEVGQKKNCGRAMTQRAKCDYKARRLSQALKSPLEKHLRKSLLTDSQSMKHIITGLLLTLMSTVV